jgi:hypothetical protein
MLLRLAASLGFLSSPVQLAEVLGLEKVLSLVLGVLSELGPIKRIHRPRCEGGIRLGQGGMDMIILKSSS